MPERERRSAAAAQQVQAILEAAEESAERIRADAEADAAETREAAARLTERADELERRLDELAEGVRTAVAGLKDELAALRRAAAEPEAEPEADAEDVDPTIAEAEAVAAREPDVADAGEEAAVTPGDDGDATAESPTGVEAPAAPEGARVLALKMALDGTPRDETARYLRENFDLADPEVLLDEVYAKAGG
jgi:hypothetical protein